LEEKTGSKTSDLFARGTKKGRRLKKREPPRGAGVGIFNNWQKKKKGETNKMPCLTQAPREVVFGVKRREYESLNRTNGSQTILGLKVKTVGHPLQKKGTEGVQIVRRGGKSL